MLSTWHVCRRKSSSQFHSAMSTAGYKSCDCKHTHFTNLLLVFNSHNLFTQVSVCSQSLANAVMEHRGLRDLVLLRFLDSIDAEWTTLCRRSLPSTFRRISTPTLGEFNWELMVDELQAKAPTLLRVLSTMCQPSMSHLHYRLKWIMWWRCGC